jgi:hypothetical protein
MVVFKYGMTSIQTSGQTPASGYPRLLCFLRVASGWRGPGVTTRSSRNRQPTRATTSTGVHALVASSGSVPHQAMARWRGGKGREGRGGEKRRGEQRARHAVRGRREVGAEALRQAAVR